VLIDRAVRRHRAARPTGVATANLLVVPSLVALVATFA